MRKSTKKESNTKKEKRTKKETHTQQQKKIKKQSSRGEENDINKKSEPLVMDNSISSIMDGLSTSQIQRGMILSEILGRPVSRRRDRRSRVGR